jgi:N12 class adenine-specific DNA methylase
MQKENRYFDYQLEAIRTYYEKLLREKDKKITFKEAVVEWLVDGHAEEFRNNFLNGRAA